MKLYRSRQSDGSVHLSLSLNERWRGAGWGEMFRLLPNLMRSHGRKVRWDKHHVELLSAAARLNFCHAGNSNTVQTVLQRWWWSHVLCIFWYFFLYCVSFHVSFTWNLFFSNLDVLPELEVFSCVQAEVFETTVALKVYAVIQRILMKSIPSFDMIHLFLQQSFTLVTFGNYRCIQITLQNPPFQHWIQMTFLCTRDSQET